MPFAEVSLSEIIEEFGEENVKKVLSNFICEENNEVESFIRNKAINHEKRGLAKTILILDSDVGNNIVAFYTISTKSFFIETDINSSLKKKYFGTSQTSGNIIPSILIGQLGKNEAFKNSSFSGSNLMDFIFNYIKEMSKLTPSIISYVEHDGSKRLREYYEKYGFTYFKRKEDEKNGLYCHMIKTKDIINSFKK